MKTETSSSFTYTSTQSSGFSVGTTYQYKYRAKNKYGYGDYSPVLSMVAGKVPDQLAAVTTSITSAGKLAIDWNPSPNDHSSSVTQYEVKIQNKASTAVYTAHSQCDGTDSSVITNTNCEIDMTGFSSAPYNYAAGDLIVVQVLAKNAVGWSTASPDNSSGQ